jgi:hypothetical protein
MVRPTARDAEVSYVVAGALAGTAIKWAGEYGAGASREAVSDALMRYFDSGSAIYPRVASSADG